MLTCAIPEIKAYCNKEHLKFKALVLVYVNELSENMKFIFLPPTTTAVIQPMDQEVISTFKSYYLRRTFKLLLSETDGQDNTSMLEFWKKFNSMKAIEISSDSWDEVKPSCMKGVWRKIWPECVHRTCSPENDDVSAVCHETTNLARV